MPCLLTVFLSIHHMREAYKDHNQACRRLTSTWG